jgi:DNA-binding MarR family transcriptional regulator
MHMCPNNIQSLLNLMAGRPKHEFDSTKYIPALLSTLNNRLTSNASDMYLKHFGVGINEWRILTVMARTPECSSKFIADQSAIHITVISRSLRDMAAKGLVNIDRTAWQRSLTLTEAGRETYDKIAAVALKREKLLLQGINAEEVAELQRLLERMTENIKLIESYDPAAPAPVLKSASKKPQAREAALQRQSITAGTIRRRVSAKNGT